MDQGRHFLLGMLLITDMEERRQQHEQRSNEATRARLVRI